MQTPQLLLHGVDAQGQIRDLDPAAVGLRSVKPVNRQWIEICGSACCLGRSGTGFTAAETVDALDRVDVPFDQYIEARQIGEATVATRRPLDSGESKMSS